MSGTYISRSVVIKNHHQQQRQAGVQLLGETVHGNLEGFTQRDQDRAYQARKLCIKMGAPDDKAFKAMLQGGFLNDNDLTGKDIDRANQIFGSCAAILQGKSTRHTPPPARIDIMDIPPELIEDNRDVELTVDGLSVCGVDFLSGIDKSIRLRHIVPIMSRRSDELRKGLQRMITRYTRGGFRVKTVFADREFKPVMQPLEKQLGVRFDFAASNAHIPAAERNNRTIEERMRVLLQYLPFSKVPKVVIRAIASYVTDCMNYYPAKGGISSYYSPHILVGGRRLSAKKDFRSCRVRMSWDGIVRIREMI
jgi:hypothetical protein